MPTQSADEYNLISTRLEAISKTARANSERLCFKRETLEYRDCWCYRANPDGTDIPCPPASG